MGIRYVLTADIEVDPTLQLRADLGGRLFDEKTVESYVEEMEDGVPFPPVVAFEDPKTKRILLGGGFHRLEAYRRRGEQYVEAEIRPGGYLQALFYAATQANKEQKGKDLTPRCRRNKLRTLLLNFPELLEWSDNHLKDLVGMKDNKTAGKVVDEVRRHLGIPKPTLVKTRRGTLMSVGSIGPTKAMAQELPTEWFKGTTESLRQGIKFTKPAALGRSQIGLFWAPGSVPDFTKPKEVEVPRPNLEKLAALVGKKAKAARIRLNDKQAQALVQKMGDLKPGELAKEPDEYPHVHKLVAALRPYRENVVFIYEDQAERILAKLGAIKPGDLGPVEPTSDDDDGTEDPDLSWLEDVPEAPEDDPPEEPGELAPEPPK